MKLESRRSNHIHDSKRGSPEEHEAWIKLNKCKHAYTKEVRAAKKGTWMNFCNQIEGVSATARLHKLIARDPSKGPGILQRDNGSYTENVEESADVLLQTHFPGCVNIPAANGDDLTPTPHGNSNLTHEQSSNVPHEETISQDMITKNKIEWALFSFEKYKSPGNDQIYPIMLQKAWHFMGDYILNIYRASLNLAYIPKEWQRVNVIFIPKPGKDDYTSPKSFRPISLTSVLLKGLEKLMDRLIKDVMNDKSYLHKSQHAFQEGKSTETALHELVSQI